MHSSPSHQLREVKTHKYALHHISCLYCQNRLIDFNQTVACRLSMFISMPCARLSWPSRQLLSARKSTLSYRIVLKITVRILTNSLLFYNASTFSNRKETLILREEKQC